MGGFRKATTETNPNLPSIPPIVGPLGPRQPHDNGQGTYKDLTSSVPQHHCPSSSLCVHTDGLGRSKWATYRLDSSNGQSGLQRGPRRGACPPWVHRVPRPTSKLRHVHLRPRGSARADSDRRTSDRSWCADPLLSSAQSGLLRPRTPADDSYRATEQRAKPKPTEPNANVAAAPLPSGGPPETRPNRPAPRRSCSILEGRGTRSRPKRRSDSRVGAANVSGRMHGKAGWLWAHRASSTPYEIIDAP